MPPLRQRDGHSQDWVALYRKAKKATPFHFLYRLNDQLLLFLSLCLYSPALIHRVWSFTHVHYSLPPRPPFLTLERQQRQWGTKRSRLKRLTLDNAAFSSPRIACMPNFALNCVLNLNHKTCSHRTKFHCLLLFFASLSSLLLVFWLDLVGKQWLILASLCWKVRVDVHLNGCTVHTV